ncbi:regulatory protein LuxR (plasmid) [Crinalium epipsammum PCC 9333]|uniref:Regulatory protein LuxR n=1 Tax=Crinalium epipsammum PCC 9333 TaxID=1173022 RepID=K9W5R9_9CYAN|nr:AAA-like domain-containing protein [Crinalium epipsammum]AFZ15688.1 regulatory protein LuxR [Crinalium epipsammum PCC 9333]
MKKVEFNDRLEQLTRFQKPVLKQFLAGKTDKEITDSLGLSSESTTRKHISNVCKVFDLTNGEGEHLSYRPDLIDLFIEHHPDWVAPQLRDRYILQKPEPDFPGRPVALDSNFYIAHPSIEEDCAKEVLKPGGLVRLKGAKKMGKTSLLNRTLAKAEQEGYRTVYLNLRQVDTSIVKDLDRFLQWFCASVSKKLGLKPQLDEWDSDLFGSLTCCTDYFQMYLLEPMDTPLVVGMDEVDRLFEYPAIAESFFPMLRGWYEARNNDPATWSKLRQVVVYATDVYINLNSNQSPFNVGPGKILPKLTREEVAQLAQCYGLRWSSGREVDSLMALVGGHPYLIQLALYHIQKGEISLEQLLASASTLTGIYRNHLEHLRENLESQPSIVAAFKKVITSPEGVELLQEASYKLQGLGLVELNNNQVKLSSKLYQHYFQESLG